MESASSCLSENSGMATNETDFSESRALLEELLSLDEVPVSFQNALIVNQLYQGEVSEAIAAVENALEANREQQDDVEQRIRALQQELSAVCQRACSVAERNEGLSRHGVLVFTKPYFKDIRGFTHPPNPDTVSKRAKRGIADLYQSKPREWTREEKNKLTLAVREDALRQLMRPLLQEKASLSKQVDSFQDYENNCKDQSQRKQSIEVAERLRIVRDELQELRCMNDQELFSALKDNHNVDWLRICGEAFNGSITARCCQLMWNNLLHPKYNKGRWSESEDRALVDLVNQNKEGEWSRVAMQLGSNRSGLQCLMRFQQRHRENRAIPKWTRDEDIKLKTLVEELRVNNFVPWAKVVHYMPNRTRHQCYQRYQNSLRSAMRKGSFSELEDIIILIGIKVFGIHNWAQITDFIPNRTSNQLYSRYHNFLRNDRREKWSVEQDTKLLQFVKEKGTSFWATIAKKINKDRFECRRRYMDLQQLFLNDPDTFDSSSLNCKTHGEGSKTSPQKARRITADSALKEFLSENSMLEDQSCDETLRKMGASKQDLIEFMFSLRQALPQMNNAPELTRLIQKKKNVRNKSTALKNRRLEQSNRIMNSLDQEQKVDINALNGDPMLVLWWNSPLSAGRNFASYNQRDSVLLYRSLKKASQLLQLNSEYFAEVVQKSTLDLLDVKDQQVLQQGVLIEEQENLEDIGSISPPAPKLTTEIMSKSGFPLPLRHYGRSRISRPRPTPSLIGPNFVAPNVSTLLGMRALLLMNEQLCIESGFAKPVKKKNDVLRNGVLSTNLMLNDVYLRDHSCSGGNKEKDERLYQRMKTLFFWPAVLSATRPEEKADSKLLLEEIKGGVQENVQKAKVGRKRKNDERVTLSPKKALNRSQRDLKTEESL